MAFAQTSRLGAVESSHCALLNLPGEIRNRIYDFATEDGLDTLKKKHEPRGYIWKAERRYRWYTSLTQVCRPIRTEFLPLYTARTVFVVALEDLRKYIDVFVMLPGVAEDDVAGSIIIADTGSNGFCIDIKPLIDLRNKARDLHISWFSEPYSPFEDVAPVLNVLTCLEDTPLLHTYIDQPFTAVKLFNYDYYSMGLQFTVKDEFWKEWMEYWVDAHRQKYQLGGWEDGNRDWVKNGVLDWADAIQLPKLGLRVHAITFTRAEE